MNAEHPSSEQVATPEREKCRAHNHVRDTWAECRRCRGDGETYSEPDYEGDWAAGYHRYLTERGRNMDRVYRTKRIGDERRVVRVA